MAGSWLERGRHGEPSPKAHSWPDPSLPFLEQEQGCDPCSKKSRGGCLEADWALLLCDGQKLLEEAGVKAGRIQGVVGTQKSPPNAACLPVPLADVHNGEGGGHPVQPARVQHHRLHLRPRGTDVSTGPHHGAGLSWWPRQGDPSLTPQGWEQSGLLLSFLSHTENRTWKPHLGTGWGCKHRVAAPRAPHFWWQLGEAVFSCCLPQQSFPSLF